MAYMNFKWTLSNLFYGAKAVNDAHPPIPTDESLEELVTKDKTTETTLIMILALAGAALVYVRTQWVAQAPIDIIPAVQQ